MFRLGLLIVCFVTSCTPLEIFAIEETVKTAEDLIDEAEEDFDRDLNQSIRHDLAPHPRSRHERGREI